MSDYVDMTVAKIWWSFAVKEFWYLWDNITFAMAILLRETYIYMYYNATQLL
jgi:hypothetical protein